MNLKPDLITDFVLRNELNKLLNKPNSNFMFKFNIESEYLPFPLFQPYINYNIENNIIISNKNKIKGFFKDEYTNSITHYNLFSDIKDYLISSPHYYSFTDFGRMSINNCFKSKSFRISRGTYNSLIYYYSNNFLAVSCGENNDLEMVYSLMFKKEHLEYLKLCVFLNEYPDPSIFRLDVHEDVLNKNFKYPSIKTQLNKRIRLAIDSGIEIVYRKSFEDMFLTPKIPQFRDIREVDKYQDLLNNLFYDNIDKAKELDSFNYYQADTKLIKHKEIFPKMYNKPKYKLELTYD